MQMDEEEEPHTPPCHKNKRPINQAMAREGTCAEREPFDSRESGVGSNQESHNSRTVRERHKGTGVRNGFRVPFGNAVPLVRRLPCFNDNDVVGNPTSKHEKCNHLHNEYGFLGLIRVRQAQSLYMQMDIIHHSM
jgi:hypothetical protein